MNPYGSGKYAYVCPIWIAITRVTSVYDFFNSINFIINYYNIYMGTDISKNKKL